jgi:hypothetical protein
MRKKFFPVFLLILSSIHLWNINANEYVDMSKLRELDTDWSLLSELDVKLDTQEQIVLGKRSDIYLLSKVKVKIIEGDLPLAKFLLSKVNSSKSKVSIIKRRYKAIIHFIEGDYQNVLNELDAYDLNQTSKYTDICMLKVLARFAQPSVYKLNKEYQSCGLKLIDNAPTDMQWLDNLMAIRKGKPKQVKGANPSDILEIIHSNETIKIWLKTGIYTNKEKLIKKHLADLPPEAYKSKTIRELIGLIHYRLGDKKAALSFIDDIYTPNAENIKGNINLENKKYELAFGHFMLALQKKKNSINALERSVPLSYLLDNWDDGINLLQRIVKKDLDPRRKLTLDTVFRLRKENITQASQQVRLLERLFHQEIPFELEQIKSYIALREFDNKKLIESSHNACRRFDGLNCWVHMQTNIWENLGKTLFRKDKIHQFKRRSIASLKERPDINKMKEVPFIDQRDIVELDSAMVNLRPRL